jgi:hypothetical protein
MKRGELRYLVRNGIPSRTPHSELAGKPVSKGRKKPNPSLKNRHDEVI